MSQEYPLIKIQDMNSGDIVLDEKNEKMVVYVNSTCSLFTKDGMQHYPKPASQYRLVQKKRFACPLNHVFYITEKGAVLSFKNREMWYQECAIKGIEPKVKRTVLAIPDCQKPIAAFQSFSEAIAYKAKQDEPQWFVIYKDERGLWALTKSHVVHPDIEVVDETQSLRDKIHSLELTHQDLIHELTRLRSLDDENDDLYSMKIDLEERVSDYSRVNGQLVAEVLNLRSNKTTLEAELTEKKRDIVFYKEKIEDLEANLKLPEKYRDELTAEHKSQIEGVRQSLKATKEQYEANLKAKDEAFSTLQLQATNIENHRDKLLEDLEESRKKFETCEDHRRFLLKKVDEELEKVELLDRHLQRVVAEKSEVQHIQAQTLIEVGQEVSKLKDRVADLMEKNEELKGSLQILETKRVKLQCQLEREEGISTKWHQEAVACHQKLEKLSALANLHA